PVWYHSFVNPSTPDTCSAFPTPPSSFFTTRPRLSSTLFPYTTLFRSQRRAGQEQNDVEQNELLLPYDQNAFIEPYLPRAECSKIAAKFCGKNPVSPVDICRLLRYNKHRSGQPDTK